MTDNNSWVNENLVAQLLGRLQKPGVAQISMAETIAARMEQTAHPLPLLDDLETRWQSVMEAQDDALPFVFAQPAQPEASPTFQQKHAGNQKRATGQKPLPVVAAKQVKRTRPNNHMPTNTVPAKPSAEQQAAANLDTSTNTAVSPPLQTSIPQPQPLISPQKSNLKTQPSATEKPATSNTKPTVQTKPSLDATSPQVVSQSISASPDTAVPPMPVAKMTQTAVSPTTQKQTNPNLNPSPDKQNPASTNSGVANPGVTNPGMANPAPKNRSSVTIKATPIKPRQPGRAPTPLVTAQNNISTENKTAAPKQNRLPVVKPTKPKKQSAPQHMPAPKTAVQLPEAPQPTNGHVQSTKPGPRQPAKNLPLIHAANQSANARHDASLPMPTRRAATNGPTTTPSTSPAFAAPAARPSPTTASNVIQRNTDKSAADDVSESATETGGTAVDIDEIVAEVHRQFKRELAIEGERRGVLPWQ